MPKFIQLTSDQAKFKFRQIDTKDVLQPLGWLAKVIALVRARAKKACSTWSESRATGLAMCSVVFRSLGSQIFSVASTRLAYRVCDECLTFLTARLEKRLIILFLSEVTGDQKLPAEVISCMTTFWVLLMCVKDPFSQWCPRDISKHKEQELVPGSLPLGWKLQLGLKSKTSQALGSHPLQPLAIYFRFC